MSIYKQIRALVDEHGSEAVQTELANCTSTGWQGVYLEAREQLEKDGRLAAVEPKLPAFVVHCQIAGKSARVISVHSDESEAKSTAADYAQEHLGTLRSSGMTSLVWANTLGWVEVVRLTVDE